MFKPYYTRTDVYLSCVEKIDALLLSNNKTQKEKQGFRDLPKEILVKHTRLAIAMKEFSTEPSAKNNLPGYGKGETENYKRALRWILEHTDKMITEQDVLYLHRVLTLDLVENFKSGRYRKTSHHDKAGQKTKGHHLPSTSAISKLTRDLVEWVERSEACHPVILSAIFHLQLILIQPFADANSRLARIMGLWILIKYEYKARQILGLEDYFAADQKKYFLKIQQAKQADGDFTGWIDYIAQGVLETLEATEEKKN